MPKTDFRKIMTVLILHIYAQKQSHFFLFKKRSRIFYIIFLLDFKEKWETFLLLKFYNFTLNIYREICHFQNPQEPLSRIRKINHTYFTTLY